MSRTWLGALRQAAEAARANVPLGDLAAAGERLSLRYRDAETGAAPVLRSDLERLAYVTVRMPATATVLARVLAETRTRIAGEVTSLLDLGAGPLTSLWAAAATWPGLASATLVDRDPALMALGTRLWQSRGTDAFNPRIDLLYADITTLDRPPASADVVLLSYAIGELAPDAAARLLARALRIARLAVAIVEPGTPRGFARLRELRGRALEAGAHVAAPCPHELACPMAESDWCHFAVRVERSRAHRLVKHGALGWEDEKFAYLVVSPAPPPARPDARILRHPITRKGHVTLRLCRDGRADEIVVARRATDYRQARHANWGDAWPSSRDDAVEDVEEPDADGAGP